MNIVNQDEVKPHEDFCGRALELIRTDDYSIALIEIDVGKKAPAHKHAKCKEAYYIVAGEGQIKVGNSVSPVRPGSSVEIPLNTLHSIKNIGQEVLRVLAFNTPPYDPNDHLMEPWRE